MRLKRRGKCKCWLQQTALLRQIYCCVLKHQMPDLFWQEVIYLFLQPHLLPVQNAVLTKAADIRAKKSNQVKIIFEKDQQLLITVCGHVLTGQSQEKQIEGRKNRRTWSPTQRSRSNLRRVGTTHKTRSRIWMKQIFVLDSMFIFKEEACRLRCVISKTLVLPQRYFTQILPLVMAETICSPMCGARRKTTPD